MKIVFMGTPDFSVPALEMLAGSSHEIVGVVTQPDKPKGRGGKLSMSPVKEKALALGIPVLQPVRARDTGFLAALAGLAPEGIVVIAYGQILPDAILKLPKYGCVNVHASLLPKYRGAAPIQWAVLNGDTETGVTTMLMDTKMDTGDILEVRRLAIAPDETGGSLFDRLSVLGAGLIVSTMDRLEAGELIPVPQDHSQATYVKKIDKAMGEIDWSRDGAAIERLTRGLAPWPSAYTWLNGKMLKIWSLSLSPDTNADGADWQNRAAEKAAAEAISADAPGAPPGTVLSADTVLTVQTGSGPVYITSLQLSGKKRMDAAAFLRGYPVAVGTRLGRNGQ